MCVIIIKPEGCTIGEEVLRDAWMANPHGMGFAVWEGDRWIVKKGFMKLAGALKAIQPHDVSEKRLVVHFRFATHGGRSPELTHPFDIQLSDNTKAYLFHNGVLSVEPTAEESDTSQFAGDLSLVRPDYEGLKAFIVSPTMETIIGGDRIVLIKEDSPEIFYAGHFYKEGELLFSSPIYVRSLFVDDESEEYAYWESYYEQHHPHVKAFRKRKK